MVRLMVLVASAALSAVVLAPVAWMESGARAGHAGGMDAMAIDMDAANATANVATSLGSSETCRQINENDTQDADETSIDTLTIDVTASGIPAYSDNGTPGNLLDDSGGIVSYGYILNYPPANLLIATQDANFLLAANTGSSLFSASDGKPDGDGAFNSASLDTGVTVPEDGSGVLDRLTVSTKSGAVAGMYALTLTSNAHLDGRGTAYAPDATLGASVAVNQACGAPTTGTATPQAPPPPATAFHDSAIKRLGSPQSVRLIPGIPDTQGPLTVVVANNQSDHADDVGVYLAFLPPAGAGNPATCAPALVLNLGVFDLLPKQKITVRVDPPWQCATPSAVTGLTWTLKALADIHADDFTSCATLSAAFNGSCTAALADDDLDDFDNAKTRSRPIVTIP